MALISSYWKNLNSKFYFSVNKSLSLSSSDSYTISWLILFYYRLGRNLISILNQINCQLILKPILKLFCFIQLALFLSF
ncbi:hypothetical protein BpHYR1_053573 [Brachionus plicatilis]|uniref:Uncharacterized protein n=1 Tax=Brachionus plicatilis TaxID=10195 RepID=A0A3M7QYE7_BRAPC|nr:hypothetical protein BpHYR1_053573 [Brachionus plicatilis]